MANLAHQHLSVKKAMLLLLFLYTTIRIDVSAACPDWVVAIQQPSTTTLCSSQEIELSISVDNDTATLSECQWYIKKPTTDYYQAVASTLTVSYNFDEVGTYSAYATIRPNDCTEIIHSDTISIELYAETAAGKISADQTICHNTIPTILTETLAPTGGNGTFTRQWQQSADGSSWSDIANETSATYQPAALTQTTKYRLQYTGSCATAYSNAVTIAVRPPASAPAISATATTLCHAGSTTLSLTQEAAGAPDEAFEYQWQESADGNEFTDIPNETGPTYTTPALTTARWYRIAATSSQGCGSIASAPVKIDVYPDLTTNIIAENDTVCYNSQPATLSQTIAPTGGDGTFTYQWQSKTTDGWTDITGANETLYQPEALTATTCFRLVATTSCGSVVSNEVEIYVCKDLTAPVITTFEETVCQGSAPALITISTLATCDSHDHLAYQWQQRTTGTWQDISGATSPTYQPEAITTAHQYRVVATSARGCGIRESNVHTVNVYESIAPGTIAPTGADTICYGFAPDAISVITPASGGDGIFSYQWMQRQEGVADFSYIPDATGTTYAPPALYKTTEYQLEVTNACAVKYTNTVKIVVREQLQAPVLAEHTDTICYNTVPNPIVATVLPTGGVDDAFSYQWEVSTDGQSYTDIAGETATTYQPNALRETHWYRLRATSVKLCGDITSNAVKVNVYDSLRIAALSPDPVCYMTPASLSVSATGGGDKYNYQWQDSVNGAWNDISGASAATYETVPKPEGNYYYRCIVATAKCESGISPVIKLSVYEEFTPGAITVGTDSTCYGYAPAEPLRMDIAATGADGQYAYQWQKQNAGAWQNIAGATATIYQPEALFTGTNYRLQVASKCDTLYTNNIFIRVNPLPDIQAITGSNHVCYNQYETYSVETLEPGFSYEWLVEHGTGDLTTAATNTTSVDIFWTNPNSTDSVVLRVTNDITGCGRDLKLGVTICNEQAPERTVIVRKPNSDILVCEADKYWYQWGYTDKNTLQEFPIDDSNRRYVLLPHAFDNITYDYWLILRPSEASPCYSRSYYAPENDTLITPSVVSISVPTFVHGSIPIVIQNPHEQQVTCSLYNLSGEAIATYDLGKDSYLSATLPISLQAGLYVMHVSIGDYVKPIKLIAE